MTSLERITARRSPGFTVTELLVVISIIVIIVAILLPAAGQLRANARSASDLLNQRSLVQANLAYATDNAGYFASPRTNWDNPNVRNSWVKTTGIQNPETETNLSTGTLWNYLNATPQSYKSPLDPTDRIRSYSFSSYVGVTIPDDWTQGGAPLVPLPPGQSNLDTRTLAKLPRPAETLATIGELDAILPYNLAGWIIDWSTPLWIDTPATWNGVRVNHSTYDGAVRSINIMSQRFRQSIEESGYHNVTEQLDGSAWAAIRGSILPGRLPY
jgi:prepilin-type N-terminal cleavage/methylation domain-containing protein